MEGTPQAKPEEFQPGGEASSVESAPQPGSSPADPAAAAGAAATPPKLTTDQVAAAIAATPGSSGSVPGSTAPATADDADVIETEWVDKAEHEIATHQGDPYGEEEAIEDLQQDYLKKRYGYKVSNPNSDSSKPEGT
jgi:hypothetical protein